MYVNYICSCQWVDTTVVQLEPTQVYWAELNVIKTNRETSREIRPPVACSICTEISLCLKQICTPLFTDTVFHPRAHWQKMASAHASKSDVFLHPCKSDCEPSHHGSWEHLVNLEVAFVWMKCCWTILFKLQCLEQHNTGWPQRERLYKCVDSLTFPLNSIWIHDPGHHHCQLHRSGPGATSAWRGQDAHVKETCEDTHMHAYAPILSSVLYFLLFSLLIL